MSNSALDHRRETELLSTEGAEQRPRGFRVILRRVVLASLSTLVSVNLWTGGPLFSLWVGSRIQAAVGHLSMAAVVATVAVLILISFALYQLLAIISAHYDEAVGRRVRRRQAPWLKPISGERRSLEVRQPLTAVEKIVVATVLIATFALEVWFFFFAHYSLPGGG
jgi:hypothetical protein